MKSKVLSQIDIDALKAGESVKFKDLMLKPIGNNTIEVAGWSTYNRIENLTKDICLYDLNKIKLLFSGFLALDYELSSWVSNYKIKYCLYFDDYGKTSIEIVSDIEDQLMGKIDMV